MLPPPAKIENARRKINNCNVPVISAVYIIFTVLANVYFWMINHCILQLPKAKKATSVS